LDDGSSKYDHGLIPAHHQRTAYKHIYGQQGHSSCIAEVKARMTGFDFAAGELMQ